MPDDVLEDLRARLRATRWPDQVGAPWEYGADLGALRDLCAYWADGFDWRAHEARLNELDHVLVDVEGHTLHAVRARGAGPAPLPLVLLHGWPSSFVQMLRILPLLTDPAAHGGDAGDAFDVIVPSLPGFGFSSRPTEPGMHVTRAAELVAGLLDRLGVERFGLRSSDLGAGLAGQMATALGDRVIGSHTSGTNPFVGPIPEDLSPAEERFVEDAETWMQTEMAYAQEHSTRPQTLAYGLNDSPAGLAGWIIEKFHRWGDLRDGNLDSVYGRDELLVNLTIYWVTQTIGSSIRMYYETARGPQSWGQASAPVAHAQLPADMFPTPREWAERSGPVARWTELPRGGHFGEWEVPDLLAGDIRAFFRDLR